MTIILDCKVNEQMLSNFCMPPLPHPKKYEVENENSSSWPRQKLHIIEIHKCIPSFKYHPCIMHLH